MAMVTTINQFAQEDYVLGIDSYGWNGATLPDSASKIRFVYVLNNDPYNSLWTLKHRDAQINAAIAQGKHVGVFSIWRSVPDAQKQVDDFLESIEPIKDSLTMPHVKDCEDRHAPVTLQTAMKLRNYFLKMFDANTYTAPWWWDKWIKPFDQYPVSDEEDLGDALYNDDLWVCDPPPDDLHLPGRWAEAVMRQKYIDLPGVEGMNASVDIDLMPQSEWDRLFPKPPNPYLRKLIEGRPMA
jgi:hypothetical protein